MPLNPDVLLRQTAALHTDLHDLLPLVIGQLPDALTTVWPPVTTVYLTGVGDSHHACQATEFAFTTLGGVRCRAVSAQRLALYGDRLSPGDLVVGVSASGGTEPVVQALDAARAAGCRTLAVAGADNSAVGSAAEAAIAVPLRDNERSPGLRTYQASLIALFCIAVRLGELGTSDHLGLAEFRRELSRAADVVSATAETLPALATVAAEELCTEFVALAGSGPSQGTAQYAAAKLVETAGVPALGQDLEEWWHVERFVRPPDTPLVVIAPPGRSHPSAVRLASRATAIGRRVITVQDQHDHELARHARVVLPVRGALREEFSPLTYHIFAGALARALARRLDRSPFLSDLPINATRPTRITS